MSLTAFAPFFDTEVIVFIFRYVSGLGGPMAVPAVSAIVSLIAPPHRRGAWTGLTIGIQSLGRAVAPASLGILFDVDHRIPFCITGGVALLAAVLTLCLAPRVPRPTAPTDKGDEPSISGETPVRHRSTSDVSLELSKQCETLLCALKERRAVAETRKISLKDGLPDTPPPATEEERMKARAELSEWFVKLLESNGWTNWPAHLDGVKLMLFNSFPPIRTERQEDKVTDIIAVLDRHIGMAEKSEMFEGGEDLFRAMF